MFSSDPLPFTLNPFNQLASTTDYVGFPGGSDGKESACNVGDLSSIPGLKRSPGGGPGNPLQYCCPQNPMDRGAWQGPWGREESDIAERHSTASEYLEMPSYDTLRL